MADTVKEAVQSTTNAFLAWPLQKRITMVASLGLGMAVLVTMLMYAQKQALVPLMSNLSEEDAAQIIAALENDHVHYELGGAGTAVMVPEGDVYRLRLKLAGEGLPRGGNVGFELFDSPSFGMSRFAEQLNFRRGLEGELRRTIRQIDSVKDARVHIVVPEQSLFRDQEKHASAAVTLHLRPGRVLAAPQVQAIVHMVSSSVAGLSPERVTVVDSSGHILAKGGEEGGGMGGMLEQQRNIERSVEERVHAMLAPIVGADHVVVRASAAIDLSRTDKTTETYDPASQATRSRQESEEKRTGPAAAGAQGIPGARSNLTGIDANNVASPSQPGISERRSSTSNYEINKVVAHEIGASGRLSRLSVAVLVDGFEATGADGSKTFQERPATELSRYEELARRAMGFDADREDQVSVQSIPFGKAAESLVDAEAETHGLPAWVGVAERFWPPLVALIAVALLGTVAWRARPTAGSNVATNPYGGGGAEYAGQSFGSGRTVRELEAAIGRASADGQGAFRLGSPPPDVMAKLTTRLEPKLAASVLKGWLNEPS